MRLEGLSDPDISGFNNDVGSDDNRSLATSEPPLETNTTYDLHDYANMSRPQSAHVPGLSKMESNTSGTNVGISSEKASDNNMRITKRNLDSRSLVDMIKREEQPTLDIKKTVSMENLTKFGTESKEYQAYIPDNPETNLPNPREFLSEPDASPGKQKDSVCKQLHVTQADESNRLVDMDESDFQTKGFDQPESVLQSRRNSEQKHQQPFKETEEIEVTTAPKEGIQPTLETNSKFKSPSKEVNEFEVETENKSQEILPKVSSKRGRRKKVGAGVDLASAIRNKQTDETS